MVERIGDIPKCVVGDEGKLRQVLINLLGNAVKFTHRGGIALRVRAESGAEPSELRLRVEVEDSGSGISEEESDRLFRRFEQTESGRQTGGGTGLGLAISREFVRLMDGDIAVSSQVGKGSPFSALISDWGWGTNRLCCVGSPISRGLPRLRPESPACRLLIVDDKEDNRSLLRQMLAPTGFDLREAVDGADGTQAVRGVASSPYSYGRGHAGNGWL